MTKDVPSPAFAKLLAQLDPVGDILRRSPYPEFTAALERPDRFQELLRQPALDALTRSQRWPDISATLGAARHANQISDALAKTLRLTDDSVLHAARSLGTSDVFTRLRQLDQELTRTILAANRAILPTVDAIRPFAERAIAALQPAAAIAEAVAAHQTTFARMAKLTTPWVLKDHPAVSATGFVRIARLRDVAAEHAAYEPAASEAYEEELGEPVPFDPDVTPEEREAAAINAGTNPDVVAFPAPAFPQVLVVAGFEFDLPASHAPASDDGDRSGGFDPQHGVLLRYLEHRLRTFVEAELRRIEGHTWIRRRVPKNMRDKWAKRREQDRDQRGDSYPPIYYADLTDLTDLICQANNWDDAFDRVFKHKDDLQVGIRRLNPIRNALAHSRPLVRADQLSLSCEAFRLLRALGVVR